MNELLRTEAKLAIREPINWASTHPMLCSVIVSLLILAIFVPLTLRVTRSREG